MTALLAEGFGLGLSTGFYCLGACAPLLIPYLLAEERGWLSQARIVAEFLAGRLAAYLVFALAVGVLSARLGAAPPWAVGTGLVLSGSLMLAYAAVKNAPVPSLCGPLSRSAVLRRFPLLLGFAVGINLCPPFVAGLVRLAALRDVPAGMLYFAAFFAGTALYTLPVVAAAPFSRIARLRDIACVASALAGLWFVGLGVARLV